MSRTAGPVRGPLFTPRGLAEIAVKFVAAFLLAWGIAQGVKLLYKLAGVAEQIPSKWPLSLVETRLAAKFPGLVHGLPTELATSAGILLVFFVFVRWCALRITRSMVLVVLAGFVFVLCTNLIHGPWYGLIYPHQGKPQPDSGELQYYHDAVKVSSAGQFLREFEAVQPELGCHSRTHPPGAVLLFYALVKTVGHGAAVSIVIAAMSVGLSGVFLYRVLAREFDPDTCGYVTLLFLLMPSIQVYYCASLDAVIASCCLGVLLFLRHPRAALSIAGTAACLFCAAFLTFGACFLLPVLVGFEIITQKTVRKSLAVVLGVAVLYVGVDLLWGFNYLAAFRTASALENPDGFLLFADPISYLMTRLENLGDILVFFGPFLLVLFVRGLNLMRKGACAELATLSGLGLVTLLAMFLAGAFKTGETARACLFIYPYLMFPVATCLHDGNCRRTDKRLLLWLVFGQTLVMQAMAGFYW